MKWVKEKVVRYKRLGGINFVEKIEKNHSGMILRKIYRGRLKHESEVKLKAKL